MSRTINRNAGRRSRRMNTFLWIGALTAATIALIYYQQTEILYILATLGVTVLLAVVALADLKGAQTMTGEPVPNDDAAAISSGLQGRASAGTSRAAKRK